MPPGPDNERLFNARVLLKFAAQEIRQARSVDAGQLTVVVCAASDALTTIGEVSRSVGVEPPDLAQLDGWVRRLREL